MRRVTLALGCILALACSSNPTPSGGANGTGQRQLSALSFNPGGADFSLWVNRFKDEVYSNWLVPQAAATARGRVDFEFTVDREGALTSLRVLNSSGTSSLDKAAESALTTSQLAPLPRDYRMRQLTIQVSFLYN